MSKVLNILVDEGASFFKALKFSKKVKTGEYTHPVTNVKVPIYTKQNLNLTGYTVTAQIREKADPNSKLIQTFTAGVASGTQGLLHLSLSRAQTSALGTALSASSRTDTGSQRVYTLGYYDVLLTSSTGEATRIFEGKCYLSRAASSNPLSRSSNTSSINKSSITAIGSTAEVRVDETKPHLFVGIRYFNGNIPVTPTGGTVAIYRKPTASQTYQTSPMGVLVASTPSSELTWIGNTLSIKANASNITGATSYQIVAVGNIS